MKTLNFALVLKAVDMMTGPLRGIHQSNSTLMTGLTGLKKSAAELSAQQGLISKFKSEKLAASQLTNRLEEQQKKIKSLTSAKADQKKEDAALESQRAVASEKLAQIKNHRRSAEASVTHSQERKQAHQGRLDQDQQYYKKELDPQRKSELKADLTASRAELKKHSLEISKNQKKLQELQKAETDAAKALAEVVKSQAAATNSSKKLDNELNRELTTAKALKGEFLQQQGSLESWRRKLSDAGIQTNKLAAAQVALRQKMETTNKAIKDQKDKLNNRSPSEGMDAATSLAGAASAYVGVGQAKKGFDFETELTDLGNIAGLTNEQLAQVGARLQTLSGKDYTNRSAQELLEGVKAVAQEADLKALGLSIMDVVESSREMGRTATASRASVDDLAKTTTAFYLHLGGKPKELSKFFDLLTASGKAGAFELKNMAEHFPNLAPHFKTMKVGGMEAVATLAAMAQVAKMGAGSTASAATNLENFLTKMSSPETVRNFSKFIDPKKIKQFHLEQYTKVQKGKMVFDLETFISKTQKKGLNPIEEMIKLTGKVTEGNQFAIGKLFGDMQVQAFLRPMLQNFKQYEEIKKNSLASKGVVDADYQRNLETTNERLKALSTTWSRLTANLTRGVQPTINAVLAGTNAVLGLVNSGLEKIPGAAAVAGHAVAAGLAITGAASVGGLVKAWSLKSLLLGVPTATTTGTTVTAAPVAQGVFQRFAATSSQLFSRMTGQASAFFGRVSSMGSRLFAGLGPRLATLGRIPALLGQGVVRLGGALLRFAGPIGLWITAIYMWWDRWKEIKQGLIFLWEDIASIGKSIGKGIANGFSRIKHGAQSLAKYVTKLFKGLVPARVLEWLVKSKITNEPPRKVVHPISKKKALKRPSLATKTVQLQAQLHRPPPFSVPVLQSSRTVIDSKEKAIRSNEVGISDNQHQPSRAPIVHAKQAPPQLNINNLNLKVTAGSKTQMIAAIKAQIIESLMPQIEDLLNQAGVSSDWGYRSQHSDAI